MIKIIDQLLPDGFFKRLQLILNDEHVGFEFDWHWSSTSARNTNGEPLDSNFMFTHFLYNKDYDVESPHFETFFPIVYFLEEHIPRKDLVRMKLNLYPNQGQKILHTKHVDLTDIYTRKPFENHTVTILNFTTCNGGTIIGEEKYLSKGNQALSFDNKIEHQGFTQTDTQRRIVLNIATTNTTK